MVLEALPKVPKLFRKTPINHDACRTNRQRVASKGVEKGVENLTAPVK